MRHEEDRSAQLPHVRAAAENLTASLEAYAEEALKEGPIEVEITARPEKEEG
jgi:hypothetical protein